METTLFYKNIQYLYKVQPELFLPYGKRIDSLLSLKDCKLSEAMELSKLTHHSVDMLSSMDIERQRISAAANIKMLVLDVDGVMTDGKIIYSENGDELKQFNSKDGLAIRSLKKKGIKTGFLSHGIAGNILKKRADILYADYLYLGSDDKMQILSQWAAKEGINLKEIAYVGDDLNDLEVIKSVGLSACPADAVDIIKSLVHVILSRKGGEGAVRELIDYYL